MPHRLGGVMLAIVSLSGPVGRTGPAPTEPLPAPALGRTGPALTQPVDAASLLRLVHSLDQAARALVVTARAEEEPADLVAWMHHRAGAEVAVLALHRGESAGNRFGREVGEALGILRVHEVLGTRRIAGGAQFFTRAFDMGPTDSAAQVWGHWNRPLVTLDVVTVIRSFRPHIVIVGCEAGGGAAEGQRGAVLPMVEAALAGATDTAAFRVPTTGWRVPWATPRLYQVACGDEPVHVRIDLGAVDPALGASYAELGARAQAWQRSQGLGRVVTPGPRPVGLTLIGGTGSVDTSAISATGPSDDPFIGLPTAWTTIASTSGDRRQALARVAEAIARVQDGFDVRRPGASLDDLLSTLTAARTAQALLPGDRIVLWRVEDADLHGALATLEARLGRLIAAAAGIVVRLDASRATVAVEDSLSVTLTLYNRGDRPVRVLGGGISLGLPTALPSRDSARTVRPDSAASWTVELLALEPTRAWWARGPRPGDFYSWPGDASLMPARLVGEEAARPGRARLYISLDGVEVPIETEPLSFSRIDPALGEVREPVAVLPPVTVLLERVLDYTRADRPLRRRLLVEVTSWTTRERDVTVGVEPPEGVRVSESTRQLSLAPGERAELLFELTGRLPRERHTVQVGVASERQSFSQGVIPIRYDHITPGLFHRGSALWLDAVPIDLPAGAQPGYLPGEHDQTHVALRQLDVNATELTPAVLDSSGLARYRRIAIGPRAFLNPVVRRAVPDLLDWVRGGGRLVVLSGGSELTEAGILPWPVHLPERPRHLAIDRPVFNAPANQLAWVTRPHRLDEADFDEWARVVGRFLPDSVDQRYTAILEVRPGPGEPGVPVAWATGLGRGMLVYTVLDVPRQVAAGEGGAIRLLLNFLYRD